MDANISIMNRCFIFPQTTDPARGHMFVASNNQVTSTRATEGSYRFKVSIVSIVDGIIININSW